MYSLVLLASMSPGADVTPAPAAAAPIITGCCGSVAMSCTGCCGSTGYGVTYGSGCCSGYHTGMHMGGLFGHGHFGSCHGSSCTGHTCCGGGSSCCGGYSCAGGGASSWGPPIGMPPYTLHGYNSGGGYGYGQPVVWADSESVYGRITNVNSPTVTIPPTDTKPMVPPKPMTDPVKGMGANIKFKVPADARLFVDGKLTVLTGTERSFTTPSLVAGEKFFYDVKAELMVNGFFVVEEKRVIVEAGSDLTESFPKLFAAAQHQGNAVAGK
jgi:uncharacterized protein (TIGR03000 family)